MKPASCLILIFIISSCGEDYKAGDIDAEQTKSIIKSVSDYSNIVGQWSMCSESHGVQVIQYNACPIITFNTNGIGTRNTPGEEMETFTWTLCNNLLNIISVTVTSNKTFPDTNYIAIFKQGSGNNELELRQEKKDFSFYLSRKH